MKSLVLITGATGAVGPRVAQAFHEVGYPIRTLSIDPPKPGSLPAGIEVRIGDITDLAVVQSAMQGVEVVIHLAALLHILNPSPSLRNKYKQINVNGTANVVKAALESTVQRVVLSSTIAVYGDSAGRIVNEDTPPHPDTLYSQSKLAAEQVVLDARRSDGQPFGTVLRFGSIYGAGIKGNYFRLVQSLARGRFIPIGGGQNRRTLIYDRDVGQAVLLAAFHGTEGGKIYNVSDGQYHTMTEIITAICRAIGRKPPAISLPVEPVRLAASLLDVMARLAGWQSPITIATTEKYTEDIAVDSSRIQTQLGFKPRFDLQTGWQETIREMRRCGDL